MKKVAARFSLSVVALINFFCLVTMVGEETATGDDLNNYATVTISRSDLSGIGLEKGVSRRDPSDIIKVGDLYYVWYSKGPLKTGYEATVWYATSSDGLDWTEEGQAVAKGEAAHGMPPVCSPQCPRRRGTLLALLHGNNGAVEKGLQAGFENRYGRIGFAGRPWKRLPNNPVLKNSDNPDDFDSLVSTIPA